MMYSILVFLSLIASSASIPGDSRIVNGQEAAMFSHPYQVSIQERNRPGDSWYHNCGGALIGLDKVLTAAHCVMGRDNGNLRVALGMYHLMQDNPYLQNMAVRSYWFHEDYDANGDGFPNDIAIIHLDRDAVLNQNVQIADLAPQGSNFDDTYCVISGWGRIGDGTTNSASTLREVNMTQISQADCRKYWPTSITDKVMCIFEEKVPEGQRPTSCLGDSGGPLMCGPNNSLLAGINSWGGMDCDADSPVVYSRVSEYLEWIHSH